DLDKSVSKIGGTIGGLGRSFTEMFSGVVDKVAEVGVGIAKWGTIGALGVVTLGVTKLNAEFEKTQISMAAVFNANGVSSNINSGLGIAKDMMTQIRKDAAALPGETGDLIGIFRANTIPGLRAGADIKGFEKFSANVMAAGA